MMNATLTVSGGVFDLNAPTFISPANAKASADHLERKLKGRPPGFDSWPLRDKNAHYAAEYPYLDLTDRYRPAKAAPRPANDHEEDGRQPEAPPPNGPEDYCSTAPPKVRHAVTEALRSRLLVSTWLTLDLHPRDYLLGEVLCTTSRWLIFGETGIGKTLVTMDLGAAIAAGQSFLNWEGRRPSRVMYLDGDLPSETFKERMELIAERYGPEISFWGYNRDVLRDDDMPPLNTPDGVTWLLREIEALSPDLIIFDAIMCLLAGSMSEEESWAPVKLLMRQLSARRIAQIWLHHAGHDASKGFGTKTHEWELDTVVALLKADPEKDDGAIRLEFRKARLRAPATASQFAPQIIRRGEGDWITETAPKPKTGKQASEVEILRRECLNAYDRLSAGVATSPGFNGAPVRKVSVEKLRDELKSRGFLGVDEAGKITNTGRSNLHRAKTDLLNKQTLIEAEGMIWRGN
jgi:hypothetical protein